MTALPLVSADVPALPPCWQLWADPAISEDPCPGNPNFFSDHNRLKKKESNYKVSATGKTKAEI